MLALGCAGSIDDRLAEIRALQDAGEFSSSIESLREILGEQPDHPEANYLLGLALVQTGQPTVAIWPLQKAAKTQEFAVPAGIMLASTLMNTGSFDEAIRAASAVLEADPERTAALQVRANAELSVGKPEDALADADRFLEIQPDAYQALVLRATALSRLERFEEAEQAHLKLLETVEATGEPGMAARGCLALANFYSESASSKVDATMERCVRQFPTDPVVIDAAATYYDRIKNQPEVVNDLLRRAMEEEAEAIGPRFALAQRLDQQGKSDEARALLREGAELFNNPEAWARLASFHQTHGAIQEAYDANQKALELLPEPSEELLFRQADLLVELGRAEEAEALAEKFEQETYRDLIRGRLALARGDAEAALQAFEAGLLRWPDNAPARFLAGVAAERSGQLAKAVSHYREAVRADDSATDAALAAARLELARGKWDDASAMALKHVEGRGRRDPEAYVISIRALTAQGFYEEARKSALAFDETAGKGALQPVLERAALERRAVGPAASLRVIDESGLDLTDPGNLPALRLAVEELLTLDRGDEALARISRAAKAHPQDARLPSLEARVQLNLGRVAAARAAADRAAGMAAEDPEVLAALGRVAFAEGDAAAGLAQLDRAVAAQPEDVESAYLAAQIALSRGDAADAERRLREIVARHPGHAPAANDLAWMLADRDGERERALELAERAARLDPRPEILDTLGWVQLQAGDAAAATATFERALAAEPDAPSVRYRYALALEAEGRADEALAALRRALEAGGFPELEQARAQVARLEARNGGTE